MECAAHSYDAKCIVLKIQVIAAAYLEMQVGIIFTGPADHLSGDVDSISFSVSPACESGEQRSGPASHIQNFIIVADTYLFDHLLFQRSRHLTADGLFIIFSLFIVNFCRTFFYIFHRYVLSFFILLYYSLQ